MLLTSHRFPTWLRLASCEAQMQQKPNRNTRVPKPQISSTLEHIYLTSSCSILHCETNFQSQQHRTQKTWKKKIYLYIYIKIERNEKTVEKSCKLLETKRSFPNADSLSIRQLRHYSYLNHTTHKSIAKETRRNHKIPTLQQTFTPKWHVFFMLHKL